MLKLRRKNCWKLLKDKAYVTVEDSFAREGRIHRRGRRVLVPGLQGQFEILNNHAPIISILQKGVVEYDKEQLPILGGFVEVQKNVVSLCIEKEE